MRTHHGMWMYNESGGGVLKPDAVTAAEGDAAADTGMMGIMRYCLRGMDG